MADDRLTLIETPIPVAWNVRGDPAQPSFTAAVQAVLGLALPTQTNTSARRDATMLLWLGPKSWLYAPDAAAIAAGINRLASDRRLAASLGEAGFEAARKVTWDGVIETLLS